MIKPIMKILYLDQFIVSDLADSKNQFYIEMRESLEELVFSKKLICPLSMEHYMESSSRSDDDALKNDNLMNSLSGGMCFYDEFYITTFLINAKIKNKPFAQDMYIDKAVKNIFRDKSNIEKYRNISQKFKGASEDTLNVSNRIRESTREQKIKDSIKSEMFSLVKRLPSISFTDRIEDLVVDGQITIRGEMTPIGEKPNQIDLILEYLLRHFKFNAKELLALYSEFKEDGFDNIPTLDILTSLRALQSILHKKLTSNDDIDNLRIACGLPISDVLMTDRKRKSEIIQLELDKKYNCQVLCGNNEDMNVLKSILTNK